MAVIDITQGKCSLGHHTIRPNGVTADSKHFQPADLDDIREWRAMVDRRPFRHCLSHSDVFHDRVDTLSESGITQPQYNASRKRAWILGTSQHEAILMHALFIARTDSKRLVDFIDRNFWNPWNDLFQIFEEAVLKSDVPASPATTTKTGGRL